MHRPYIAPLCRLKSQKIVTIRDINWQEIVSAVPQNRARVKVAPTWLKQNLKLKVLATDWPQTKSWDIFFDGYI